MAFRKALPLEIPESSIEEDEKTPQRYFRKAYPNENKKNRSSTGEELISSLIGAGGGFIDVLSQALGSDYTREQANKDLLLSEGLKNFSDEELTSLGVNPKEVKSLPRKKIVTATEALDRLTGNQFIGSGQGRGIGKIVGELGALSTIPGGQALAGAGFGTTFPRLSKFFKPSGESYGKAIREGMTSGALFGGGEEVGKELGFGGLGQFLTGVGADVGGRGVVKAGKAVTNLIGEGRKAVGRGSAEFEKEAIAQAQKVSDEKYFAERKVKEQKLDRLKEEASNEKGRILEEKKQQIKILEDELTNLKKEREAKIATEKAQFEESQKLAQTKMDELNQYQAEMLAYEQKVSEHEANLAKQNQELERLTKEKEANIVNQQSVNNKVNELSQNAITAYGNKYASNATSKVDLLDGKTVEQVEQSMVQDANEALLGRIAPTTSTQDSMNRVKQAINQEWKIAKEGYSILYNSIEKDLEDMLVNSTREISLKAQIAKDKFQELSSRPDISKSTLTQLDNIITDLVKEDLNVGQLIQIGRNLADHVNYEALIPDMKNILKPIIEDIKSTALNQIEKEAPKVAKTYKEANRLYKEALELYGNDHILSIRKSPAPEKTMSSSLLGSNYQTVIRALKNSPEKATFEAEILRMLNKQSSEGQKATMREISPYLSAKSKKVAEQIIKNGSKFNVAGVGSGAVTKVLEEAQNLATLGLYPSYTMKLLETPKGQQFLKKTFGSSEKGKQILAQMMKQKGYDILGNIFKTGKVDLEKVGIALKDPSLKSVLNNAFGPEGVNFLRNLQRNSLKLSKNMDKLQESQRIIDQLLGQSKSKITPPSMPSKPSNISGQIQALGQISSSTFQPSQRSLGSIDTAIGKTERSLAEASLPPSSSRLGSLESKITSAEQELNEFTRTIINNITELAGNEIAITTKDTLLPMIAYMLPYGKITAPIIAAAKFMSPRQLNILGKTLRDKDLLKSFNKIFDQQNYLTPQVFTRMLIEIATKMNKLEEN